MAINYSDSQARKLNDITASELTAINALSQLRQGNNNNNANMDTAAAVAATALTQLAVEDHEAADAAAILVELSNADTYDGEETEEDEEMTEDTTQPASLGANQAPQGALRPDERFQVGQPRPVGVMVRVNDAGDREWVEYFKASEMDFDNKNWVKKLNNWRKSRVNRAEAKYGGTDNVR